MLNSPFKLLTVFEKTDQVLGPDHSLQIKKLIRSSDLIGRGGM